jgi:hypothetical protein
MSSRHCCPESRLSRFMLPCEEASAEATSRTEPENKVPYFISPRGDIEQAFLLLEQGAERIPAEQSAHKRSGCDWAEEMEDRDKQRHYQQQWQEECRKREFFFKGVGPDDRGKTAARMVCEQLQASEACREEVEREERIRSVHSTVCNSGSVTPSTLSKPLELSQTPGSDSGSWLNSQTIAPCVWTPEATAFLSLSEPSGGARQLQTSQKGESNCLMTEQRELEATTRQLDANGLFLQEECKRLKEALESSVEERSMVCQWLEKKSQECGSLHSALEESAKEVGALRQDKSRLEQSQAKAEELLRVFLITLNDTGQCLERLQTASVADRQQQSQKIQALLLSLSRDVEKRTLAEQRLNAHQSELEDLIKRLKGDHKGHVAELTARCVELESKMQEQSQLRMSHMMAADSEQAKCKEDAERRWRLMEAKVEETGNRWAEQYVKQVSEVEAHRDLLSKECSELEAALESKQNEIAEILLQQQESKAAMIVLQEQIQAIESSHAKQVDALEQNAQKLTSDLAVEVASLTHCCSDLEVRLQAMETLKEEAMLAKKSVKRLEEKLAEAEGKIESQMSSFRESHACWQDQLRAQRAKRDKALLGNVQKMRLELDRVLEEHFTLGCAFKKATEELEVMQKEIAVVQFEWQKEKDAMNRQHAHCSEKWAQDLLQAHKQLLHAQEQFVQGQEQLVQAQKEKEEEEQEGEKQILKAMEEVWLQVCAHVYNEKMSYTNTALTHPPIHTHTQVGEIQRMMHRLQRSCLEKKGGDDRSQMFSDSLRQNLSHSVAICGDDLAAMHFSFSRARARSLSLSRSLKYRLRTLMYSVHTHRPHSWNLSHSRSLSFALSCVNRRRQKHLFATGRLIKIVLCASSCANS